MGFLGHAKLLSSAPDGSEAWLELRKTTIGGSDAGIILGVNDYQTARDLWFSKQNPEAFRMNPYVEMGIRLEKYVKARVSGFAERGGVFQHPEREWMTANVDGVIESGFFQVSHGLECKVTGGRWEDVPATYFAQCQHYMMVTGLPRWEVINAIPDHCRKTLLDVLERFKAELPEEEFFQWVAERCEMQSFMIESDEVFQARLLERELEFLAAMQAEEPPEEVVPEGELILLENEAPDVFGLFHDLCELNAAEKSLGASELAKEANGLKSELKTRLSSFGALKKIHVGPNSATWVAQKDGGYWRFNLKGWE